MSPVSNGLKLQALVYDILPGGRCQKAMLGVCNGLSHGYLRAAAQLTQRSAVPPQLHADTTTNTVLCQMTDSVTRPNGVGRGSGRRSKGTRNSLERKWRLKGSQRHLQGSRRNGNGHKGMEPKAAPVTRHRSIGMKSLQRNAAACRHTLVTH